MAENGFKASVFANSDGLTLASHKHEDYDDAIVAAMVALLSDATDKAKEELNLKFPMEEIRIKWSDLTIWCRQIIVDNQRFLLTAISPPIKNAEIEKYQADLMDWAVQNSTNPLRKLTSL